MMKRLFLITALLLPGLAYGQTQPPSAQFSDQVVPATSGLASCPTGILTTSAANTITIDYSQVGCALQRRPFNQISNIEMANGPNGDAFVASLHIGLERTFYSNWNHTAGTVVTNQGNGPSNMHANQDPMLDDIVRQGAVPIINMDMSGPDAASRDSCGVVTGSSVPQFTTDMGTLLTHLRGRYPTMQYIEIWNEPDGGGISETCIYDEYQLAVSMISAWETANPSLLPWKIGCCAFIFGTAYNGAQNFFSDIVNNRQRLDFYTEHPVNNACPGATGPNGETNWAPTCVADIVSALTSAGLNPNLPQMWTEWGGNGNTTSNGCTKYVSTACAADAALNGSFVANAWGAILAYGYQDIIYPSMGFVSDYDIYSRTVLVPYEETTLDSVIGANGNVYLMGEMQKTNAISLSGYSGDATLAPIASIDSTGAALLFSNETGNSPTVNVTMNNLPAAFQSGSFNFTEYLVDQTHSNSDYSGAAIGSGLLQAVVNTTESAASSFSQSVAMTPYSVYLIVLTPTQNVVPAPAQVAGFTTLPLDADFASPAM